MTNISTLNLTEPCVLILGAGASHPYGFPTGQELKSRIIGHFDQSRRIILNELNYPDSLIEEFRDVLKNSSYPTIDIFLEKKQRYRDLGSHMIALTIMPLEEKSKLFPKNDWYGQLFDLLNFENSEPDTSNLSIVTLNYDRSLECFLDNCLKYDCSDKNYDFAWMKRGKIRVIHAHGSFGEYPKTPYGMDFRHLQEQSAKKKILSDVSAAANGIKIISDKLDDSEEFKAAQDAVANARHVVFLGFGYNETTLSQLLAKSNHKEQVYYGTAVDLPELAIKKVHSYFESKSAKIVLQNQPCAAFIQLLRNVCKP